MIAKASTISHGANAIRYTVNKEKADIVKANLLPDNISPEAMYVQSAELDGKPLDRNWLYRSDVYDGGTLTLHMRTEPCATWGTATPPPYTR